MTTIIIDLETNQWLALIGAFGMGAVIACILTWPFVHMRGYEKRGYEKAEHVEGILNNRKASDAR